MDYIKNLRNYVGHECLILSAGNLIIYDQESNYYLQRKPNGKLAFVGGFINPDETVVEGTIREAKEEVDLDCNPDKLSLYAIYSKHTMEYPNGDQVRPHSLFFKYKLDDEVMNPMPPETLDIVKTKLSSNLVMINEQHQELLTDLIENKKGVILK